MYLEFQNVSRRAKTQKQSFERSALDSESGAVSDASTTAAECLGQ